MNIKLYGLLFSAVILNALANIVLKWAMRGETGVIERGAVEALKSLATNYWAWLGIALFGLAFIVYSMVLSKVNLSIAYPVMTSLGLVIISLVSMLAFREIITTLQWLGLFLIITGVWLVSAAR